MDALRYAESSLPATGSSNYTAVLRPLLRRGLVYGSAVVLALIISGTIFSFTPFIGISLAHTQGISMEPVHKQGDVVLIEAIDGEEAQVGDIIVFAHSGRNIMHRVIDRYDDPARGLMLVTQGDNVPTPDRPITAAQVSGRQMAKVPGLGELARAIGGDSGYHAYRSIVISLCVFSIALWGIATSAKAEQRKKLALQQQINDETAP
jgi:signal peptidase I